MIRPIITFDFDLTLTRNEVQEYAKSLILDGFNIYVVTARYDDLHAHLWSIKPTNDDLWEIIDKINLPREKVIFTNMKYKYSYFRDTDVYLHLDDNQTELSLIKDNTKVIPVDSLLPDWKEKCERLIKLKIK